MKMENEYILDFMELTLGAIKDIDDNFDSTDYGYGGSELDIICSRMKDHLKNFKLYLETKDNEAMN